MKIGCTCGFIGVCGVFAFIAQLVGIIIPKVLVLEIMLHRDRNITLGKFIETVHMEAEEESSDEDDILEIESLTRDDMEYMHNIEKLVLKERNKENGQGTNNETKRKHTTKRNLNRKIENVTNIQNDISNENDMAKDNSTVRAGKTLCKDSSDETSSSSEEEDEEEEENEEEGEEKDGKDQNEDEEEEGKAKYEDENKGEREEEEEEEGDDDDDDDDDNDDDDSSSSSSSSCGESSESVEEETESHASYSSISIGLWNSYICTKDGTNQTECASMSFPDALHILKKDARGFIEAGNYHILILN